MGVRKFKSFCMLIVVVLVTLLGCSRSNSDENINAFQNGMDSLIVGDYEKALAYFEISLEQNPEDDKTKAYLEQTEFYIQAKNLFETNDLKSSESFVENVVNVVGGSEVLVTEGQELLEKIREKESEEIVVEEDSSEEIIELYNAFSLPLKVLLAATTVDERAMTPELLGYTLYFNFDYDFLLVNIHSGAGVGHPWFLIQYDKETITPVEGLVYTGMLGYKEVSVNPSAVSKVDLYNRYLEFKEAYDLALKNVSEQFDMTISSYEEMKNKTTQ